MGFDFKEAWREGDTIFVKKEYFDLDEEVPTIKIYSDVSTNIYEIYRNLRGYWYCTCPAFENNKECKHLKRLGLPDNNVEIKIVEE